MRKTLRITLVSILAIGSAALLSGCQTTAEGVKSHVAVTVPTSAAGQPYPVVFFLQGTGGGNHRADLWAARLAEAGIASAVIDNAGLRGRTNLSGVSPRDIAQDYAAALQSLRDDPRLDTQRHAVMGFSSGGTAAMLSAAALESGQPRPRAVIAFYPGGMGECRENHAADTVVHVFYGDRDEWGSYRGTRDACRRMAEGNPTRFFHLLQGAHHGFDDTVTVTWPADGRSFRSEPNPQATAEVEQTLVPLLKAAFK